MRHHGVYVSTRGFQTGFFVRGGRGDFVMLGTLGACPIEIMPSEIIELELTNFN